MSDEISALVFDNGSGITKAGFARSPEPQIVFPTVLGKIRPNLRGNDSDNNRLLIGEEAESRRGILTLRYPIQRGFITDWDDMVKIWQYSYDRLEADPIDHPILLTGFSLKEGGKERLAEIFFETFEVPAMSFKNQALLSILSAGLETGIVLESGYGITEAVPVYKNDTLNDAIGHLDIGGHDFTEGVVPIGEERVQPLETLFQPPLHGVVPQGIHQLIFNSIQKCVQTPHQDFFGNIVIAGGNTRIPGMIERLENEIRNMTDMHINVTRAPENSAWKGGSILASNPNFNEKCVSKEEYQDGNADVLKKFFGE